MRDFSPVRIEAIENKSDPSLIQDAAAQSGLDAQTVTGLILQAGSRLTQLLESNRDTEAQVIQIDRLSRTRIEGIAGLIRLSPGLELEVVPKFLSAQAPSWREDFFLIASLVNSGRLLPLERLRSSHGERGDLASLVARAMIAMYWEQHRRPLRTYRTRDLQSFEIDGALEPVSVALPEPDGFTQSEIVLDRSNQYNAVISAAARTLIPEVRDRDTRLQLLRVFHLLQPQSPKEPNARFVKVPGRHRDWQSLVDVSVQVLRGFGANYSIGPLEAPGFVVRTWAAWQALCGRGLEMGLSNWTVLPEPEMELGSRLDGRQVSTYPDFVCYQPMPTAEPLIVDAKYKTYAEAVTSVRNTDIYESLAFMEAVGSSRLLLAYPRPHSDETSPLAPGTTVVVDWITVASREIVALEVECQGISRAGGMDDFSRNLAVGIQSVAFGDRP